MREALEEPEKRIALVTPDRGLAGRVAAHLQRWNIAADDTAGRALSQTAAGRVLLLLAEVIADHAAPVPLMALLEHPLVGAGEGRAATGSTMPAAFELRAARAAAGTRFAAAGRKGAAGRQSVARHRRMVGRASKRSLAPLLALAAAEEAPLADLLDALAAAGEALCGDGLWAREDGRALAGMVEELRAACARGRHACSRRTICMSSCAMRWTRWRCARLGAAIRAWRSTACSKRG